KKYSNLNTDYYNLKSYSAKIRSLYDNLTKDLHTNTILLSKWTIKNPPIFTSKENINAARRYKIFEKYNPLLYINKDIKTSRTIVLLSPEFSSSIQNNLHIIWNGGDISS
ncbi:hypothetical protein B0T13DRAFT_399986, partial [Neurospora crassa]